MKRQIRWVGPLLIVAAIGIIELGVVVRESVLTQTELKLGYLPVPPIQPTDATLECTRLVVKGGQYFSRDHIPCNAPRIVFPPVKATSGEMMKVNCRPQIVFQVTSSGEVSDASVSRSSGSKTLDEKSLRLITESPLERHNCGECTVTAVIGVDFQGPVWMPECE